MGKLKNPMIIEKGKQSVPKADQDTYRKAGLKPPTNPLKK